MCVCAYIGKTLTAEPMHMSRPQVNADQHQAAAWMPHFSTLHMHTPTRSIQTTTNNKLLYNKQRIVKQQHIL